VNLDDQRPVHLFHYTAALCICIAAIMLMSGYLAGLGCGLMVWWVARARGGSL
jgi:hypothetical protein